MGKNHAPKTPGWSTFVATALVGMAIGSQAATVESTTEAFVAKASVIQGTSGTNPQLTHFAPSILSAPAYSGAVSALGTGTLTDANANWQQDQFNGANGSFYLHFDSGYTADIVRTVAATKSLSYPGTLPAAVQVGSKFKIRRHLTFADIFGASNETGLQPGSNPAEADNVILHLPETQRTWAFFYSSVPGYTGWYREDFSPADGTVVYPEQGLMIRRKTGGNIVVYLCGSIQGSTMRAPVYDGFNLLGTLKSTTSLRLSQLSLYTGNATTGLAPASNPADADNLILVSPDSTTTICFYSNYPGFEGWFDSTFKAAGALAIAPGTSFFVNRKASRGLFHWSIPQE